MVSASQPVTERAGAKPKRGDSISSVSITTAPCSTKAASSTERTMRGLTRAGASAGTA